MSFPQQKHPNQPSSDMDPYDVNFPPGSLISGGEYAQAAQSACLDFRVHSSLQESTSVSFPLASQQPYSLLGHDGHELPQPPQVRGEHPSRSFHLSAGSEFIKAPSSLSGHPYHQARLRHASGRASAPHQEWGPLSILTVPDPILAPSTVSPSSEAVDSRAPARCYGSTQSVFLAGKASPAAAFTPASQPDSVATPNTSHHMSSLTGSLAVPGQTFTFLSAYETPASSSCAADEADIEYAQHRYGSKRCLYRCRFDLSGSPCNKWIVGDRTRVLRHLRNHHHLQTGPAVPALCRWDKCTHSRPMKQENLSRHIVMHLGVKWRCPHCRRLFSRDDAVHRHIERTVPGMNISDAEVMPGYEARGISESQSKRVRIA